MEAHNTYPKLTDEEYIVFERNCPLAIKRREHINFIDKIRRAFNLSPGESLGDFDRRSFKGKWAEDENNEWTNEEYKEFESYMKRATDRDLVQDGRIRLKT